MGSPAQEAFDALSDQTRRRILQYLAVHQECSAGEIAGAVNNVGRTVISSHLRVLRTSSLIDERREGRHRFYSLRADGPVRDALSFLQDLLETAAPADSMPAAPPATAATTAAG